MLKILLSLLFFVVSGVCFAKEKKTDAVKSQEILRVINEGLAKITDMKVGFRQKFGDKMETGYAEFKSGHGIYIKYESMPITLLTNKDITVYYDAKMEQKSEVPTKDSATKIFTGVTQIDDKMFDIVSVSETDEAYSVVATVKRLKSEGMITMYFSKSDVLLRRVDIKSPDEQVMRVDIYSHNFSAVSSERFKAINVTKKI